VWICSVLCVYKDADKARKHGLDEFVQATPSKFDHHEFFSLLQRLTLDYRLNDQFTCLVCVSLVAFHIRVLDSFIAFAP